MKLLLVIAVLIGFSSPIFAQAPSWLWAHGGQDIYTQATAWNVNADADGTVAITGNFDATMNLSGITLVADTGYSSSYYVAVYDKNGAIQWAKKIGSAIQAHGVTNKVYFDADHNLYVFGYYQDSAHFGDTIMRTPNFTSLFEAKYDHSGNRLWVKTIVSKVEPYDNNHQTTYSYGVAYDGSNSFYVCASLTDSADCGGVELVKAGAKNFFCAAFDREGMIRSANTVAGSGAVASASYAGFASEEPSVIFIANSTTAPPVISKVHPNGTTEWSLSPDGSGFFVGEAICLSPKEPCYYAAFSFTNVMRIGDTAILAPSSFFDIAVVKIDHAGKRIWVRQAGGDRVDEVKDITTDSNGNIFITGHFQLLAKFGDFTLSEPGSREDNVFVAKYDPTGTVLWADRPGSDIASDGNSIAVSMNTNMLYVAGGFVGSVTFGSHTVGGSNGNGVFLAGMNITPTSGVAQATTTPISISPNPATTSTTIDLTTSGGMPIEVTITNSLGEKVYFATTLSEENHITVHLNGYARGLYFVNCTTEGKSVGSGKIVVQ